MQSPAVPMKQETRRTRSAKETKSDQIATPSGSSRKAPPTEVSTRVTRQSQVENREDNVTPETDLAPTPLTSYGEIL